MKHAVEISQASEIPGKIAEGQILKLHLVGIINSMSKLGKIDVQRKDYNIYLNAYAKEETSLLKNPGAVQMVAGVESAWEKLVRIDALPAGLYTLYFNNAFQYVRWNRTVIVEKLDDRK